MIRAGLLLLLLAGAAGQWWLNRSAEVALQSLAAQWLPWGALRHERTAVNPWLNPWGTGVAWNLSFTPGSFIRVLNQLPEGYRLSVRELRLRGLRMAAAGQIEKLECSFYGVRLPLLARSLGPTTLPRLHSLGYRDLEADLDLSLRVLPDRSLLQLQVVGTVRGMGRFDLRAELSEGAPIEGAGPGWAVRRLRLDWSDEGLLRRTRTVMAAQARVGDAAIGPFLAAALARTALDTASREALVGAILVPAAIGLRLEPQIPLARLGGHVMGDWTRTPGLRIEPTPVFDAGLARRWWPDFVWP